ncbi:hypothetical protein [Paenibacillus pseudetheri]|uniref:Uncharacterized protein n=1 Tax=Paenibacillus pseudetheri TaxID=2897682 RepID=A0ABN8FB30_9BACL|nr:hypothetical protein [Paenibacillus pseudetheri]CAH1054002.1 hypothetical protein PAECIP111894_00147 [Paenibacillus pseudetheri]
METKAKQVMKYRCIECRLIHYDTGKKDGITCKCGGMLEPLGWVDLSGLDKSSNPKERVKAMLRVQTTVSMGEHYIERVLEVDDISTLTDEERASIIDGAISPVFYEHEDTGPDIFMFDGEQAEHQSGVPTAVGDIKVKLNIDTSEVQEALKGVEKLSDGLGGLERNSGLDDKLACLDRLIALAHEVGQGNLHIDLIGRTRLVLNSVQEDLEIKK